MTETVESASAPTAVQPPVVTFKKRGQATKGNIRKRAPTPVQSESDSSDSSSPENESGHIIKRRKTKNGAVTASSANITSSEDIFASKFVPDRSAGITSTNDATKQSNWFDDDSKNGASLKSQPAGSQSISQKSQMPDGTYKGLANQTSFIQKNPDAPTRSVGPVKAPTNVRTTTLTDYAPDVCKDYKQTGYCGFGDNCKYLHDRSDYKAGWQLDREWETVTKGRRVEGTVVANANRSKVDGNEDDEDAKLDDIPFACIICKGPYREPVVTRCGHYFCERCALGRYRKDPTCAACGSGTNGVFNTAKILKKLLEKKKEREVAERASSPD